MEPRRSGQHARAARFLFRAADSKGFPMPRGCRGSLENENGPTLDSGRLSMLAAACSESVPWRTDSTTPRRIEPLPKGSRGVRTQLRCAPPWEAMSLLRHAGQPPVELRLPPRSWCERQRRSGDSDEEPVGAVICGGRRRHVEYFGACSALSESRKSRTGTAAVLHRVARK
jgi:hypothetical protein